MAAVQFFVSVLRADRFDLWWWSGLLLFFFDMGEGGAEMFVLCDRGVHDALLMRIEDAAERGDAVGPEFNASGGNLVDVRALADEAAHHFEKSVAFLNCSWVTF
ncbi:MAG: hypothetical protein AAF922_15455 [Pseudomonadota bacterium]